LSIISWPKSILTAPAECHAFAKSSRGKPEQQELTKEARNQGMREEDAFLDSSIPDFLMDAVALIRIIPNIDTIPIGR